MLEQFEVSECENLSVKIFIAGNQDLARQVCQRWTEKGACVNVVNTEYIYKFGAEKGVIVEFINYPRFPKTGQEIYNEAKELAMLLAHELSAGSFTIASAGKKAVLFNRRG